MDNLCSKVGNLFTFNIPIDLLSVLVGGVVGFVLVYIVDWLWRPKMKKIGFEEIGWNLGKLYKLRFKLKGRTSPGLCCINIEWDSQKKRVFAKWDETPNPTKEDTLNNFCPELVPFTYYQPLFNKREYYVPLINKNNNGNLEVFSGWWFGKNKGYGPDPRIEKNDKILITLSGSNLHWRKEFSVEKICRVSRKKKCQNEEA